jgi:hypothetical protein
MSYILTSYCYLGKIPLCNCTLSYSLFFFPKRRDLTLAKAKTNTDLVELARAYMGGDGFKQEVINVIPADVIYSFESAMNQVLTSTGGLSAFKNQWDACYRKYAKAWAKGELARTWALALDAATSFVERENAAGNDGQEIFDNRFYAQYALHCEEIKKIRRAGYGYDLAAAKKVEELNFLILKIDSAKTAIVNTHKVKKPGSAAKRGEGIRSGKSGKLGGAKKRGAKCRKNNKSKSK